MRTVFLVLVLLSIFSGMFGSKAKAADSRAQELLRQARAAIGGEEAVNAVRSLSVSSSMRRISESRDKSGEVQVPFTDYQSRPASGANRTRAATAHGICAPVGKSPADFIARFPR